MILKVEVFNWDKYNPRNDAKKWSWYRLQNNFFTDPDIIDLSLIEKSVLLYLWGQKNDDGGDVFKVNTRLGSFALPCPEQAFIDACDHLEALGKIRIHQRTQPSTSTTRTDPYVDVRERTLPSGVTSGDVPYGRTDGRTDDIDCPRSDPYGSSPHSEPSAPQGPSCSKGEQDSEQPPPSKQIDPIDIELANEWYGFARPSIRIRSWERERPRWADAFRKLREIDGVSPEEIRAMLAFVRDDSFWRKNAISPLGLRERSQRNGLRKFENILNAQRSAPPPRLQQPDKPKSLYATYGISLVKGVSGEP